MQYLGPQRLGLKTNPIQEERVQGIEQGIDKEIKQQQQQQSHDTLVSNPGLGAPVFQRVRKLHTLNLQI